MIKITIKNNHNSYNNSMITTQHHHHEVTHQITSTLKAAREVRKAEKQRVATEKKALKAAKKAAEEKALEIKEFHYKSQDEEDMHEKMGDYSTIMSSSQTFRQFTDMSIITAI